MNLCFLLLIAARAASPILSKADPSTRTVVITAYPGHAQLVNS